MEHGGQLHELLDRSYVRCVTNPSEPKALKGGSHLKTPKICQLSLLQAHRHRLCQGLLLSAEVSGVYLTTSIQQFLKANVEVPKLWQQFVLTPYKFPEYCCCGAIPGNGDLHHMTVKEPQTLTNGDPAVSSLLPCAVFYMKTVIVLSPPTIRETFLFGRSSRVSTEILLLF